MVPSPNDLWAKGTISYCSISLGLPTLMFDLVAVDADCDIVDIHDFIPAWFGTPWFMASRTEHVDLDIVDILQFVFDLVMLVSMGIIVMIWLNAPFIAHSLHLQYTILLWLLRIHYAVWLGDELTLDS